MMVNTSPILAKMELTLFEQGLQIKPSLTKITKKMQGDLLNQIQRSTLLEIKPHELSTMKQKYGSNIEQIGRGCIKTLE